MGERERVYVCVRLGDRKHVCMLSVFCLWFECLDCSLILYEHVCVCMCGNALEGGCRCMN